ncbi:uncharacterized protein LOC131314067 [Rhododendron vialii]|uniref:uncharacterized protein LOC131314067 n=1 Tax=Rhododendron vialii TaxID=182163 RepID=UPI00265FE2F9|nr:uncharacterized protein LOC131314067 [Rhododendron vialii]
MIFVQETKLESMERIAVQRMWGCSNMDFGVLYNSFPCVLVNVYAPNEVANRRELWEVLLGFKVNLQVPWCIGGDFNEIKEVSERVRCNRMERGIRDFSEFCFNMELMDLPMIGRKFTWTNYQNHAFHSRLDRFLVSQQWLERFKILPWGLPRPLSDHCPIVIQDDSRDWGPRPFRFLDIWLSNPNCRRIARETWDDVHVTGWAGFIFVQKLRAIKDKLKVWNKEDFGDINCALQHTEAELHQLDVLAEESQLTTEEKATRCKTKSEFWRLTRLSESFWRQKSRVNWLKLGHRNTRFFQGIANYRFKKNMVGSIKVNGRVIEEPEEIKEAVVEYFMNNFTEERQNRSVLGGTFLTRLSANAACQLEKQFEEGEDWGCTEGLQ